MAWKEYPYTCQWMGEYQVFRPLIDVKLFNGDDHTYKGLAIVDSGTDSVVVNAEIAAKLGINLDPCREIQLNGIGNVRAKVCDIRIDVPSIGFSTQESALFIKDARFDVLLGQRCFFAKYDICFEKAKNTFSINVKK